MSDALPSSPPAASSNSLSVGSSDAASFVWKSAVLLCSSAASFSAASDSVAASASVVSSTAVSELLSGLAFPQPTSKQAERLTTAADLMILVISLFFILFLLFSVICYYLCIGNIG